MGFLVIKRIAGLGKASDNFIVSILDQGRPPGEMAQPDLARSLALPSGVSHDGVNKARGCWLFSQKPGPGSHAKCKRQCLHWWKGWEVEGVGTAPPWAAHTHSKASNLKVHKLPSADRACVSALCPTFPSYKSGHRTIGARTSPRQQNWAAETGQRLL